MALEKQSKQIGDYTYEVTQFDAIKGRRVFVRLSNLLGPAFSEMKSENDGNKAIGKLLENLKEVDLDYFCDAFAECTEVGGGDFAEGKTPKLKAIFGLHFAGKYFAMFEWLTFALEVNYQSFFDEAGPLLAARLAASQGKAKTAVTAPSGPST